MAGTRTVFDFTVGAGGHARALLRAGTERVVGVDRDPDSLALARAQLADYGDRFTPVAARFSDVSRIAREAAVRAVDGLFYDLGVSSLHLDRPERGFSFRADGPLDMRMDLTENGPTAADVVNGYSEDELVRVLRDFGEERHARRIAKAILRARSRRPLSTTRELASVVAASVPRRRGGPHPARRSFQAIRIEVNRELEELATSLSRALELLLPGGRIVVIAYHSLEDRIVKRFLVGEPGLRVLTKKPLRAGRAEISRNPRARSAKLRAAQREAA
ncbi:MAG: 16S rRNA (cytosine(1402)-N(4))-methyltransferase RsmH [Actinomycetota bacterium]